MIHALNQGLKCCLLLLSCSLTNRCLTFTHPLLCFVLSHSICLFSEKSGLVHLSLGKLSQVKQGDNDLMTMFNVVDGKWKLFVEHKRNTNYCVVTIVAIVLQATITDCSFPSDCLIT